MIIFFNCSQSHKSSVEELDCAIERQPNRGRSRSRSHDKSLPAVKRQMSLEESFREGEHLPNPRTQFMK